MTFPQGCRNAIEQSLRNPSKVNLIISICYLFHQNYPFKEPKHYLGLQPLRVHVEAPPAVVAPRERPPQKMSPEDGVPRLPDHVLLALDARCLQVAFYLKNTKINQKNAIYTQLFPGLNNTDRGEFLKG